MKHRRFTATTLRASLAASLFLIILIAGGGVYVVNGWLQSLATDVSHATADASTSRTTIATLQQLQETLETNRAVIDRANSIVAESQSYQYQDEIIRDLNGYAAAAGITLTNFNFETQAASSQDQQGQPAAPAAPSGINSTLVSITIQNPVGYNNLLNFFYSIEQNLTKMQITNISLTKSDNEIASDDLTIEVYIR